MKRFAAGLLALAMILLAVPSVAAGDTLSLRLNTPNKYASVGDTVSVYTFIEGDVYNAYHLTYLYNEEMLTFVGAAFADDAGTPQDATASGGILTVMGYGEAKKQALILTFTTIGAGDAAVQLRRAYVDKSENALRNDAPSIPLDTASARVTIHVGGCPVTLPPELEGASSVAEGQDYTFAAPPGYIYEFQATMGDDIVPVIDNGDGTYTVRQVTAALVIEIVGTPTARTYRVTLTGSGADDVVGWTSVATYGDDYTLRLSRQENFDYAVSATVNGKAVQIARNGDKFTIPGGEILGDVTILVTKVPLNETTQVVFTGNGASDVSGGDTCTAANGEDLEIPLLNWDPASYDYQVTASGADGSIPVELRKTGGSAAIFIPGSYLQGGIVMVTITKTPRLQLNLTVTEYVKLSGETVFRVTATPAAALPQTQGLYYDGAPMVWSSRENAYVWLVSSGKPLADVKAAAGAAVTVGKRQNAALTDNGDVNGSGLVDINDAQLVYDIYNGKHPLTDSTRDKFLRADTNGDSKVTVLDPANILARLRGVM